VADGQHFLLVFGRLVTTSLNSVLLCQKRALCPGRSDSAYGFTVAGSPRCKDCAWKNKPLCHAFWMPPDFQMPPMLCLQPGKLAGFTQLASGQLLTHPADFPAGFFLATLHSYTKLRLTTTFHLSTFLLTTCVTFPTTNPCRLQTARPKGPPVHTVRGCTCI
jgi:hypothetical protein